MSHDPLQHGYLKIDINLDRCVVAVSLFSIPFYVDEITTHFPGILYNFRFYSSVEHILSVDDVVELHASAGEG